MIISKLKSSLFGQRQPCRKSRIHLVQQLSDLPVIINLLLITQLLQMLLRQFDQRRKNDRRRRTGRAEIALTDGRIDFRVSRILYGFQNSKEPSEHIGLIIAFFIQIHSQYLLRNHAFTAQIIGFDDRGAAIGDVALRTDPKGHTV